MALDVDWAAVREELRARALREGVAARDGRILPLLAQARAESPAAAARLEAWLGAVEAAAVPRSPLNGALLAWLAARPGPALAVCTSNGHACADAALAVAGLSGRVAAVAAREDVHAWKPDPEGVLALLERTGVPAERALVVGDRASDAEAGRAAGTAVLDVTAIGLDWRAAA